MEKRELAVLDTSVTAREVANKLALPIHKKGDDEKEPILLVVSTKKDIELIEWARSIRKVGSVLLKCWLPVLLDIKWITGS